MRIKTLLAAGFATALLGAATACDAVDGQAAGEDYTPRRRWTGLSPSAPAEETTSWPG